MLQQRQQSPPESQRSSTWHALVDGAASYADLHSKESMQLSDVVVTAASSERGDLPAFLGTCASGPGAQRAAQTATGQAYAYQIV